MPANPFRRGFNPQLGSVMWSSYFPSILHWESRRRTSPCFHKQCQLHSVSLCEKHILSFWRPAFSENLTWQNLEGLAELTNVFEYWTHSPRNILVNSLHYSLANLDRAGFSATIHRTSKIRLMSRFPQGRKYLPIRITATLKTTL